VQRIALRGENADFQPVSKFNTGRMPRSGILPVTRKIKSIVPSGTMHTGRMLCKVLYSVIEVNYSLNSNHKNIWHNSAADFFTF